MRGLKSNIVMSCCLATSEQKSWAQSSLRDGISHSTGTCFPDWRLESLVSRVKNLASDLNTNVLREETLHLREERLKKSSFCLI